MATSLRQIAIIIVVFLVTVQATCKKNNCLESVYTFSINMRALPDLDTLSINDTLWFELSCPVALADETTGKIIDFSNASNLGTSINFYRYTVNNNNQNTVPYPAVEDFNFVLIMGNFITDNLLPLQNRDYNFIQVGNTYQFKLGIVPQKKGYYSLGISDITNVFRNDDNCTKAGFKISFDQINQHLYYYDLFRPGYELSAYERSHVYCFKVK